MGGRLRDYPAVMSLPSPQGLARNWDAVPGWEEKNMIAITKKTQFSLVRMSCVLSWSTGFR